MKTLYLLRHATAAVDMGGFNDHERALNPRGNEDALQMAEAMKARGYMPDLILCSSARRTLETCRHFHAVVGGEVPTRVERGLYLAPDEAILRLVRNTGGAAGSVLVIGHNPGIESLAGVLAKEHSGQGKTPKFPTAALAAFQFDAANWNEVGRGAARLIDFLTPKTLAL